MHWIIFWVMIILAQSPARRKCHQSSSQPSIYATLPKSTSPFDQLDHIIGHHRTGAHHRLDAPSGCWLPSMLAAASPVPLNLDRPPISPFIRHWEPASYDRGALARDRLSHDQERRRRRRKRDATEAAIHAADGHHRSPVLTTERAPYLDADIGVGNVLRFGFYAHDRQFNVVLREDPASVFAPDVEIENTLGPMHYDLTRVYIGTLEDDPAAVVHGILTSDHLFDGTITTAREQYYVEPAERYTEVGRAPNVHSVVYRVSDVWHPSDAHRTTHRFHQQHQHYTKDDASMTSDAARIATTMETTVDDEQPPQADTGFCASERLRQKMQMDFKRRRKASPLQPKDATDGDDDAAQMLAKRQRRRRRWLPEEVSESRNPPLPLDLDVPYNDDFSVYRDPDQANVAPAGILINSKNHPAKPPAASNPILIGNYNPNSDLNLRMNHNNRNHIITNTFDQSSAGVPINSSRPSHKTHVEIITRNNAKYPHIIGGNYNNPAQQPDVIIKSTSGRIGDFASEFGNGPLPSARAENRKVTCMLYLQADHTFFGKMGSEEASIEAITRHVQRANVIYKGTDFNGDGKPDNITFLIKRIKVHTNNALKDPLYRFPGNYGVEKFLELFSEEDYDAFCLAYMFTYRDFEMGTLGLAWTGDLKNAGGVCEKNGHYRGSLKSLNTGIVTLLNYGKHVPPAVSHVTLAHEIGHNFGSPHDPEQCTPGGEDGNYIMFARATSGDKRNNNRFSPCSLRAIEPVLNTKARSHKGCFTEPQIAICGNGVVDPGEECDCGWEDDCKDSCCYPMTRHKDPAERPCTLTPAAACSPSQGPCCTDTCQLRLGDKCRNDNGCRDESFCDGFRPQCPPSVNKPNKTICNKEFVCYMGECTGSICLAYGLESCQCTAKPSDPATKACELCCKGTDGVCKSSFDWNDVPYDVPDMFAKPGTPCNDYNGYCDVFQKCRDVDPSGPLATLRKILLSEENFERFRVWCIQYWWELLLVFVVLFAMLVTTCWLLDCGYSATKQKRKLKKKSVTIIHSATTETVRLPDDNNGVIVHTTVRTKVPFKKKVRGERSAKSKSTNAPAAFKQRSHGQSSSAPNNSAAAAPKKKKRVSAAVVDEDPPTTGAVPVAVHIETPPSGQQPNAASKSKAKPKTKTKHGSKEIIDYSKQHSNTFGKVQKWLLESQAQSEAAPTTAALASAQIPAPGEQQSSPASAAALGNGRHALSKSQSTPEHLAGKRLMSGATTTAAASPAATASAAPATGTPNDKVKLQVVYKPPFKFSLKFSKNSAVKTKVLGPASPTTAAAVQSHGRVSKSRATSSKAIHSHRQSLPDAKPTSRRTAVLVQTLADPTGDDVVKLMTHLDEPNYETLTPKREAPATAAAPAPTASEPQAPVYENINLHDGGVAPAPINTATFRISKSASGSSLVRSQGRSRASSKTKRSAAAQRLSTSNSQTDLHLHEASNSGDTPFGSSQNLIRSSTSNLALLASANRGATSHSHASQPVERQPHLSRSSTTNLSRQRRSSAQRSGLNGRGSNPNLFSSDQAAFDPSGGRRAATGDGGMSRTSSQSNLRSIGATGGATNNIPRANLASRSGTSFNRHSRYAPAANAGGGQSGRPQRPHTADCTDGGPNAAQGFEWPVGLRRQNSGAGPTGDDPLPSDLEVMVSDVENLVTDT